MSFILDALKKIDTQKHQPGDSVGGGVVNVEALQRERARKRRGLAGMVAIALVSAGVTAVGFRLLAPGRPSEVATGASSSEEVQVPPASATAPAFAASEPATMEDESGISSEPTRSDEGLGAEARPQPQRTLPVEVEAPARKSESPSRRREAKPAPAPTKEPSVMRALPEKPDEELVELPSKSEVEAPVEDVGEVILPAESSEEVAGEAGSPGKIRLVGQASPERSASESSVPGREGAEDPLPGHFPKLVLQGTSVIDGAPVAVISDRRVFEGDSIDGARVVEIEERAVTLEFEGRRFTLSL
jgi:hypothetical protein